MLTVVAIMQAKEGKEKELEEELLSLVPLTRQEDGCINYDLHRAVGNPAKFVFYENWADKQALDSHAGMSHLKEFFGKAADLLSGQPDIGLYEMISDPGKKT